MMTYVVSSSPTPTPTPTSSSSPINSLINLNHTLITSKSHFPTSLNTNYPLNHPKLSLSYPSHSPRPVFCKCSFGPGEGDSRTVLDAFFLGKALGEALTERIESVVGEFLSNVGRLQAEQQKQIQDFQDDVFERAKTAKEKAAREALEAQGRLTPTSTAINGDVTAAANTSVNLTTAVDMNGPVSGVDEDEDSLSGIPIDE